MADPSTFLAKLEPGRERPAGEVRGLAGALDALVAAGWVTVRKEGRARHVRLTDAGVAKRGTLPAAPVKRATGAAALAARLDELTGRIERLERAAAAARPGDVEREARDQGHPQEAAEPPSAAAGMRNTVLDTVAELDARGRLGGLVPIPDLRAALRERGHRDDAAVTDALVELEREWRIDLNVAQSPTAVADRAAGIERPGRGLLYYVSRR